MASPDFATNNRENATASNQGLTAQKGLLNSARKHTTKKQAFGELKNVLHNQPQFATPHKGGRNLPLAPAGSTRKETLLKPNFVTPCKENLGFGIFAEKPKQKTTIDSDVKPEIKIDLFEDEIEFDFKECPCTGNCTKSLELIWAEQDYPSDEFFEKFSPKWDAIEEEDEGIMLEKPKVEFEPDETIEAIRKRLGLDEEDKPPVPDLPDLPPIEFPDFESFWAEYHDD